MLSSDQEKTRSIFPIVCIGGSAGSLGAYTDILTQIPAKAGMAIVIIAHRGANEGGRIVTLLAKATQMEVVEANKGMLLEPGRIFVAPPQRAITTDGVALRVAMGLTKNHGWPTLISDFMFSLASMCTSRAIAIVVSGMGHDGSGALAAVKKQGGRTVAQSDAEWLDMPQSAIDTSHVDLVLSASEIGRYLASLSAHLRLQHA